MAITDRLTGFEGVQGIKAPCYVASTGNLTLSSTQIIDGVHASTGQRILVKDQDTATENGIYICQSSSWIRAKDFDGSRDAVPGTLVYVDRGTAHGQSFWVSNSSSTATRIEIGTDSISFSDVSLALAGVSAFSQTALANSSAAGWRSTLGLVPGTDIQAHDTLLDNISAISPTTGGLFYISTNGAIVQLAVGSSGQVLTASVDGLPSWVTPTAPTGISVLHFQEQRTNGSSGPGYTGGQWNKLQMNTEVSDAGNVGSVSTDDEMQLASGTYVIVHGVAAMTAGGTLTARLRLWDSDSSSLLVQGINAGQGAGTPDMVPVSIGGPFALSSSATGIQLQVYPSGNASGLPGLTTGAVEVYSNLVLLKTA